MAQQPSSWRMMQTALSCPAPWSQTRRSMISNPLTTLRHSRPLALQQGMMGLQPQRALPLTVMPAAHQQQQ